ncbi:ABC transporter permease [Jiangella endophytica]|uniref:ABC transporter permease n=1 Tax=Jiangella endophytica TaxID=1623398 RepID=UPI000E3482D7|nr:ABC transporter permease [Jiangella endophytica]
MSRPDAVAAEWRKALTLPATVVALAVAVIGPVALAGLNASQGDTGSAAEAAFAASPLLTVGAIVIGAVTMGSEYSGGRPVAATFAAMPRRAMVLAAKAAVVSGLVVAASAVAMPVALGVAGGAPGDLEPGQWLGVTVYAVLTALIALGITTLTRSIVVPLIVLVANGTVVSVSFLLHGVTPLARYLPDLAGMRLLAGDDQLAIDDALAPVPGGLVMAAWTAALLAVAGVVLHRRDV